MTKRVSVLNMTNSIELNPAEKMNQRLDYLPENRVGSGLFGSGGFTKYRSVWTITQMSIVNRTIIIGSIEDLN